MAGPWSNPFRGPQLLHKVYNSIKSTLYYSSCFIRNSLVVSLVIFFPFFLYIYFVISASVDLVLGCSTEGCGCIWWKSFLRLDPTFFRFILASFSHRFFYSLSHSTVLLIEVNSWQKMVFARAAGEKDCEGPTDPAVGFASRLIPTGAGIIRVPS